MRSALLTTLILLSGCASAQLEQQKILADHANAIRIVASSLGELRKEVQSLKEANDGRGKVK